MSAPVGKRKNPTCPLTKVGVIRWIFDAKNVTRLAFKSEGKSDDFWPSWPQKELARRDFQKDLLVNSKGAMLANQARIS
jgi:hypothetical protein